MPLSVGDKIGHYEVLSLLGVGGMGEVYRAKDGKLDRQVAIKVLPSALARDPERLARFEREAKVLASLDHSNVGHIYGIVDSADSHGLVLALIEGPTLEDRIAAGPIPLEEAIAISKQIIEALEYAHDRGVVHRDLKPANIKITSEGVVKVLDFGLAKVLEDEPPPSSLSNSPTLTMGHTRAGVILGTAAYMSPEQAVGRPVDRRADIFSFGAVLYEMLTGRRAFTRATTPDVLEAVVKTDPDWSVLPAGTPTYLRRLLERTLVKDRKQRLQAIGEARILLENPAASESSSGTVPARSRLGWAAWVVAAAAILVAAGVGIIHFRETAPTERVLHVSVSPPPGANIGFLAVSPDGRRLVASMYGNGSGQLWLRSLDADQFQPLSGTENSRTPFWSTDSRFIGFFTDGKLKTIPAAGGPAQTLCGETGLGSGGTWNREGVILFGSESGPLRRVSADGGECVAVTKPDQVTRDSYPEFLPDGRHFLYFHRPSNNESLRGVYAAALDNPNGRKVLSDNSNALYAPPAAGERNGHLVFYREGSLMAQPFDADALQTAGDPFLVAGQASRAFTAPGVAASLSSNGTLVYVANSTVETQLTWLDRSGKELGKTGLRTYHSGVSFSPDGNAVAVGRGDQGLWLYDLVRGSETRLAPSGGASVWSPDGSRIAWSPYQGAGLSTRLASGAGLEGSLLKTADLTRPSDWSRDGRFLIYTQVDSKANADIWYLPDPGKPDSKPVQFLGTAALESQGQLSPDGRWIAYVSDETGAVEVYVRPFPSGPGQWKVSVNRGREPRWSRDGKEVFFLEPGASETLLAVSIQADGHGGLTLGTPQKLFTYRSFPIFPQGNAFGYSPHPDGKRFLVAVRGETAEPAINIITNWQAGLKK